MSRSILCVGRIAGAIEPPEDDGLDLAISAARRAGVVHVRNVTILQNYQPTRSSGAHPQRPGLAARGGHRDSDGGPQPEGATVTADGGPQPEGATVTADGGPQTEGA